MTPELNSGKDNYGKENTTSKNVNFGKTGVKVHHQPESILKRIIVIHDLVLACNSPRSNQKDNLAAFNKLR